jgi:UDP-arabinose 4-epimerase
MSSKNILVTGGAGYIGSHACKALFHDGYIPVTFDNLVYGHSCAVKWGPLEVGDISDRARLDAVMNKYDPIAVMHFAAFAYVGESIENPSKYYLNNVVGTLNLLESITAHGIDKFIFSSTCATYGVPTENPISERHVQNPINPYGASKLMVERILADFGLAYGLRSISLRYFNAAGADPDCEIGEDHNPETHLIPIILDVASGIRSELKIYGDDYDTVDGTCVRDYIHVTDLVEGHLLALHALERGVKTTSYNLGNGHGYSVKEVLSAIEKITNKRLRVEVAPRRPGDPPKLVCDATRANEELNWIPKYSKLPIILETAWKWHLKKLNERDDR